MYVSKLIIQVLVVVLFFKVIDMLRKIKLDKWTAFFNGTEEQTITMMYTMMTWSVENVLQGSKRMYNLYVAEKKLHVALFTKSADISSWKT